MKEENLFELPVLTLTEVLPSLSYEDAILAYKLTGITDEQVSIPIYENKGLDLNRYIGEKMECILEITLGEIYDETSENIPKSAILFEYQWTEGVFVFFPKLLKLQREMDEVSMEEEDKLEEEFEEYAKDLFTKWGISGFGLDVYEQRPMLLTSCGIFLINEHEFENEIDDWELDQKIYINIREAYLRGIRPYIPPEDIEEEVELTEAQKAEKARRAAQQERSRIAHQQMQERIRKRREAGEGPGPGPGPGFSVV